MNRFTSAPAAWLLLVAWAALIFAFSSVPALTIGPTPAIDFVLRKLGHAFVFGVLALIALRALSLSGIRWPMAWALAFASLYGVTDEIHQAFTDGRTPFIGDVLIDMAGAALALWLVRKWARPRG